MPIPTSRPHRPWWLKFLLVLLLVGGAAYGILELGHRYLGLQRLTIEQVLVTGCRGERMEEIQSLAKSHCLGKPLFWFDPQQLRNQVESKRWVKSLLIRKDPPDRLTLVIEERKPLLWLITPKGVFQMSDDGMVLDRVNPAQSSPVPVILDPSSLTEEALLKLLQTARILKSKQEAFFDRLQELRWTSQGPVVFVEGLQAPIQLSRKNPVNNIPNFQGLYLDKLRQDPTLQTIQYIDLRWDQHVVVGGPSEAPPKAVLPPEE